MANVGKTTSNEPDHGWTLFIISVVMVIASGFLVIARLATRLSKRIMGLDDYLIIAVGSVNSFLDPFVVNRSCRQW